MNVNLEELNSTYLTPHTCLQLTYKFLVGDKVRIKTENLGDTKRVPSYIKGKAGVIHAVCGRFVNPKNHLEERPVIYSVMFDLNQISNASSGEKVFVDVFEDWIEPLEGKLYDQ